MYLRHRELASYAHPHIHMSKHTSHCRRHTWICLHMKTDEATNGKRFLTNSLDRLHIFKHLSVVHKYSTYTSISWHNTQKHREAGIHGVIFCVCCLTVHCNHRCIYGAHTHVLYTLTRETSCTHIIYIGTDFVCLTVKTKMGNLHVHVMFAVRAVFGLVGCPLLGK